MNKIFTLFVMGMLCLASNRTSAQINETFEGTLPSCFTIQNSSIVAVGYNNTKSVNLPNNTTTFTPSPAVLITTPYLDFSTTTASVSFRYHYSKAISGQKTRNFRIGIVDQSGTTTYATIAYQIDNGAPSTVSKITLNGNSPASGTITASFPITTGVKRIIVEYTADGGNGNVDGFFDNLNVNGNYHYTTYCNDAPNAVNDSYRGNFVNPMVSGNAILDLDANGLKDSDKNNEKPSVLSFTQPVEGSVTMQADGTFTFTPNATFRGGIVSFKYTITDNGYSPLTSEGTVTINYPVSPIATPDLFNAPSQTLPYSNNVLTNDVASNSKPLIAQLVSQPAIGSLIFNTDGSFTYTPPAKYNGEPIEFTYTVTDESYMPLTSDGAKVTIILPEGTILPVKLISFSGNLVSNKALLTWQVADNETGSHFEVQKSLDGKSFEAHTVVFCSAKTGTEAYQYTDAAFTTNKAYYRLKTINKDGSISYSKVIYLTNVQDAANQSLRLLQNPVQNTLSFAFTAVATEEAEIAIYNMAGVKLHTQKINAAKGTNQITLDIDSKLGTGTYVLTVQSATANRVTKFVKY
jgi:hypothetical protein